MKQFVILSLLLICSICLPAKAQESQTKQLKDFLKGVVSTEGEQINENLPVYSFNMWASKKAEHTMKLSVDNVKSVLEKAKNYKHVVITVGIHTIVKIVNLEDCSQSGAWKASMPKGVGLIQKGTFSKKEDYIKNIIGIPDNQIRTVYFFN
ncbi:hypothetical protein EYV94_06740 [Puteibacter caeruleilacunae]|nr:hypothetical protein EYV94_06740 [Puteibacter caeruleilacunae]